MGVELGQLPVVAVVVGLVRSAAALGVPHLPWARALACTAIGALAAFCLLKRTAVIVGGW